MPTILFIITILCNQILYLYIYIFWIFLIRLCSKMFCAPFGKVKCREVCSRSFGVWGVIPGVWANHDPLVGSSEFWEFKKEFLDEKKKKIVVKKLTFWGDEGRWGQGPYEINLHLIIFLSFPYTFLVIFAVCYEPILSDKNQSVQKYCLLRLPMFSPLTIPYHTLPYHSII